MRYSCCPAARSPLPTKLCVARYAPSRSCVAVVWLAPHWWCPGPPKNGAALLMLDKELGERQ